MTPIHGGKDRKTWAIKARDCKSATASAPRMVPETRIIHFYMMMRHLAVKPGVSRLFKMKKHY